MVSSIQDIIPILQLSIAPVILISGIGLLLLSLTNRLGRVIDRIRLLVKEKKDCADEQIVALLNHQIFIMYHRAKIIRFSIAMAGLSVLFAGLLIFFLFVLSLTGINLVSLIILIFSLCMVSLIISTVAFLVDVELNLRALKVEIETSV